MADAAARAGRILAAFDQTRQIAPITDGDPTFDLAAAYAVSAEVTRRRVARGERPLGWKIGFTNRTIWDEYNVHAPIWGPVYDTTTRELPAGVTIRCDLSGLVEPRIEPEIVFRVARTPEPGMAGAELLACLDGVAHGFEIVQSLFPAWKFRAPDTVAAFALHGRLYHPPFAPLRADAGWLQKLGDFEIALFRDGVLMDRGEGTNVLDGPVAALAHFIKEMDRVSGERLKRGDVVTTGTVTRAFPVKAGDVWSTEVEGLDLSGAMIAFA